MLFSLVFAVNMVYQATVVGLNPLQLVLVGTTLEASVLLFEIPTGVVADVYSRRLSIIIGLALIGLGFIVEGSFPLFGGVLLAQVLWGVGYTFTSGATEAWLADEISHANQGSEESVGQAYLRGNQFHQGGALLGIGVSMILASVGQIMTPIVTSGVLFMLLALGLALVMPEQGFTPSSQQERHSWQAMGQTLRDGLRLVRGRPILLAILVISAIFGAASEGYDRLWTPHLLQNFTLPALGQLKPVIWFGLISTVGMLLNLGATEIARRRIDTAHQPTLVRVLLGLNALLIACVVVFGLATHFAVALTVFWLAGTLRSVLGPLTTAWLNHHVESSVRATLFSVNGQADALGQITMGPVVGMVGTVFSLRAALVMAGVILSPALWLYTRTLGYVPEAEAGLAAPN